MESVVVTVVQTPEARKWHHVCEVCVSPPTIYSIYSQVMLTLRT